MSRLFPPRTAVGGVLLLALVSLCGPALPAQSSPYKTAKESFTRDFKSSKKSKRLEAIRRFKQIGEPEAAVVLIEHLGKLRKRRDKTQKEYDKLGAKIRDEMMARVYDRGKTGQYSPKDLEAAERKLAPLKQKLKELNTNLEDEGEILEALRKSVGESIQNVAEARQGEAATLVGKALDKTRKPEDKLQAILSLGSCTVPAIRELLVETVYRGDRTSLRTAALDALRMNPDPVAEKAALHALKDEFWQVRTAALLLLAEVGGKDSIEPLIGALEREDGRLVTDVMRTLKTITKRDFHDNATLWREWWKGAKDGFSGFGRNASAPAPDDGAGGEAAAAGAKKGSYFYGIETRSKNVIYILDVSGSMAWLPSVHWSNKSGGAQPDPAPKGEAKMDRAIKELTESIAGLPDDATFNIVFFNGHVEVWKKKMQRANKKAKSGARKWANRIKPLGGTNIFDALEKAFQIAGRGTHDKSYKLVADTIFLLSDGDPSAGRIQDHAQILREVKKMNELSKVQVHCVGLGPNETVPYIAFLARLARENDGQFALVAR